MPDRRPLSPAWVHDFASTDKYAVIIEHPLYMNLGSLLVNSPASHIFSKSVDPGGRGGEGMLSRGLC